MHLLHTELGSRRGFCTAVLQPRAFSGKSLSGHVISGDYWKHTRPHRIAHTHTYAQHLSAEIHAR